MSLDSTAVPLDILSAFCIETVHLQRSYMASTIIILIYKEKLNPERFSRKDGREDSELEITT